MSTRFTPGPWEINSSDAPYLCAYIIGNQFFNGDEDPELEAYGEIEIAMIDMTDEPADEQIANACLIAAAPDLYESLWNVTSLLRAYTGPLDDIGETAIREANKAMDRARGES